MKRRIAIGVLLWMLLSTGTWAQEIRWKPARAGHPGICIHLTVPASEANDAAAIFNEAFFLRESTLIDHIRSIDVPGLSEDFEKAWAFVCRMTWSARKPLPEQDHCNNMLVYLNSLGFGFCQSKSEFLAAIWNRLGYQTRIWDLKGHVVPEIYAQGRWQVWDPTYHVFYPGSDGHALGIDSLSLHPENITTPRFPKSMDKTLWMKWMGFGKEVAGFYASAQDNKVLSQGEAVNPASQPETIQLPAQAQLLFPVYSRLPLYSSHHGKETRLADYAELAVYLPAGTTGRIALPLMLHAIQCDSGRMMVDKQLLIFTPGQDEMINRNFVSPLRIDVVENQQGVCLFFLINPLLFSNVEQCYLKLEKQSRGSWLEKRIALRPKNRINVLFLSDLDHGIPTDKLMISMFRRIGSKKHENVR